jgi:hypothetical protein
MNLFYDPSITELRQLVDSAEKSTNVHNVVVDFDGEVIIDPEMKYKGIDLNRFKFRTQISNAVKGNARSMKALFETLLEAYQRNSQGIELRRFRNAA